jgi:hypothetical protein
MRCAIDIKVLMVNTLTVRPPWLLNLCRPSRKASASSSNERERDNKSSPASVGTTP